MHIQIEVNKGRLKRGLPAIQVTDLRTDQVYHVRSINIAAGLVQQGDKPLTKDGAKVILLTDHVWGIER